MLDLTIGHQGELVLPEEVRDRYGFTPDRPVRLVETKTGVLIVPLTNEPMSAELQQELEDWQMLAATTWDVFSYEVDEL